MSCEVASDAAPSPQPAQSKRRLTFAESTMQRAQDQVRLQELTQQRLQEVLAEIAGHMVAALSGCVPGGLKIEKSFRIFEKSQIKEKESELGAPPEL